MIIVNCPHCGKQHVLLPDEIERLFRAGKVVIAECSCGRMYTVEQGDDCYLQNNISNTVHKAFVRNSQSVTYFLFEGRLRFSCL